MQSKPSVTLSQPVGVRLLNNLILEEQFLVYFFKLFSSTGLHTHSSYLSCPAETQSHLAFCILPHISLLVCWILEEVEVTGRNLKVAGWEKMTKRWTFYLLWSSVTQHTFMHLFINYLWMWDLLRLHIPSAVTNFMGEQIVCPGCWEGRELKGKKCLLEFMFHNSVNTLLPMNDEVVWPCLELYSEGWKGG